MIEDMRVVRMGALEERELGGTVFVMKKRSMKRYGQKSGHASLWFKNNSYAYSSRQQ